MNPHIKKSIPLRKLVGTAILSALSVALMVWVSFPVPLPFVPPFLRIDFADFPALLASFAYGPVYGVIVSFIRNVMSFILSINPTGGVGELSNFILSASFVLPAGFIYKHRKTFKSAICGAVTGNIAMALISFPVNYFLVYPMYAKKMSEVAILATYDGINSLPIALLAVNLPFTFVKGLISVIITFLIYKRISPLLKGRK